MKRIKGGLSLVIAVVMCLSLLPMTALARGTPIDPDGQEFVIENGVLIAYNGTGGHVVIPDGVTQIGTPMTSDGIAGNVPFYNHRFETTMAITGVTIPNSVTRIEDFAFTGLDSLTSITIPNSVTYIGVSAFELCEALKSVTIGNGVTSIGSSAFNQCEALTSLTIGNSVTSIGHGAFSWCTSLTSVTIPDSVTSIGYGAFRVCTELTSVTIGKGIKNYVNTESTLGSLFNGCTKIKNVTFVNGLTTILEGMFSNCTELTSITIPDSVTSIGSGVFSGCTGLTSVTIPDSVTSIGGGAFHYSTDGGYTYHPLPNVTINCVAGSYAETYAKENGVKFVATGGTTTTPPKTDNAPNIDNASGWAKPFVNEAYNNGLIPSTLQSAYTQATTRAEFCALAVTLYEKIKGTTITDRKTFDDTTDINVEKAAAIGVVSGVGNNKFDPNAKLTREQAAVMLARLAEAVGKPFEKKAATFADNGKIATWAIVQVGQIQAAGIMSGTGNNIFSPQDPYTREQSITTINRMYDVLK